MGTEDGREEATEKRKEMKQKDWEKKEKRK